MITNLYILNYIQILSQNVQKWTLKSINSKMTLPKQNKNIRSFGIAMKIFSINFTTSSLPHFAFITRRPHAFPIDQIFLPHSFMLLFLRDIKQFDEYLHKYCAKKKLFFTIDHASIILISEIHTITINVI